MLKRFFPKKCFYIFGGIHAHQLIHLNKLIFKKRKLYQNTHSFLNDVFWFFTFFRTRRKHWKYFTKNFDRRFSTDLYGHVLLSEHDLTIFYRCLFVFVCDTILCRYSNSITNAKNRINFSYSYVLLWIGAFGQNSSRWGTSNRSFFRFMWCL